MPSFFNKLSPTLIPAALLALSCLMIGCEDDPILGPTDQEPSDGGSYGIMHFDSREDSAREARLQDFIKQNPKRF